jgi:phage terminase large subunit
MEVAPPNEIEIEFRGAAAKMIECDAAAVLIDGPAGTGKSRATLTKLYVLCDRFPGVRCLLVRKTRASLTESGLVTFENIVCPKGAPCLSAVGREHRRAYDFPNGSTIVIGGLDNPDRIMSTEWDVILAMEATELSEDDAEKLMTRLFRNKALDFSQIIFDTNPSFPTHWLKRWADGGRCERFPSRHEDNPTVTPEYLKVLDGLTGHRRLRLRDGLWAAAEGAVYPEWDASLHLVDPFLVPASWRRFRSIDFGYTNPFVCQWWAVDGDGRIYLYREIYKTKTIVEDHAKAIKEAEPGVHETVADHDAEDRATADRHGVASVKATKDVTVGIQAVSNRLRKAGDGKPRLFVFRDCRVGGPDQGLSDSKKPTCTAEEFDGYCWQPGKDGKPLKEEPVDVDNHGMDAMRYAVMHLDAGVIVGASLVNAVKPPGPRPTLADAKSVPMDAWAERRKNPEWGWERAR